MHGKLRLRWGDLVICAAVLCLAGLAAVPFLFQPSGQLVCEIKQGDTVVKTVRLDPEYQETITLTSGDLTNVIEIDGESVRFVQLPGSGLRAHRDPDPGRADGGLPADAGGRAADRRGCPSRCDRGLRGGATR